MANVKRATLKKIVPLDCPNPIDYLVDQGQSLAQLAAAWNLRHTDAVYRLKRYEYPPKNKTAALMAESFGWSMGQVMDHWWAKSNKQAATR